MKCNTKYINDRDLYWTLSFGLLGEASNKNVNCHALMILRIKFKRIIFTLDTEGLKPKMFDLLIRIVRIFIT